MSDCGVPGWLAIRHAIGGVKQWSLRTSLLCTVAPVALRGESIGWGGRVHGFGKGRR